MKKVLTLVVIHDDEKILLGLKKRGFGEGMWNGFGGKVEDGESVEAAALRELEEEAGIKTNSLQHRGVINFTFEKDYDDELEVNIFSANDYQGEFLESEEMKPQWFNHAEIPYENMWADDEYWLPLILQGKNVKGAVHLDAPDTQVILINSIEADE